MDNSDEAFPVLEANSFVLKIRPVSVSLPVSSRHRHRRSSPRLLSARCDLGCVLFPGLWPLLCVTTMPSSDSVEVVNLVTIFAERAALAVARAETSSPPLPYPCGVVVYVLGSLRDLFVLHSLEGRGGLLLRSGTWADLVDWCEHHCRPMVDMDPVYLWDRVGQPRLHSRTRWLHDSIPHGVYEAVWVLKRFVAVPRASFSRGRVLRFASGSRWHTVATASGTVPRAGAEDPSDDEDMHRQRNVRLVPVPADEDVDLRVWQLLLVLGGEVDGVAELCRWASRRRCQTEEEDAPDRPVRGSWRACPGLAQHLLLRDVLGVGGRRTPSDTVDDDDDDLSTFRAFEHVLSMSCYYCLEQHLRRASRSTWTPHTGEQERQYEERLAGCLDGVAARIRTIVRDVVSGWDVVARSRGFRSAEVMLSTHMLWCPSVGFFVALGRPLDAEDNLTSPDGQAVDLHTSKGPVRGGTVPVQRQSAVSGQQSDGQDDEQRAVGRLTPLADAQLRAAAGTMLEHVHVCTGADRLGITVTRGLLGRGGRGDASAATPAGDGDDAAHTGQRRRKQRKVVGFLTVEDYRHPEWDRLSGNVPRVLRSVLAGLTAFSSPPPAGRGGTAPAWATASTVARRGLSPAPDRCASSARTIELAFRADCRVAGLMAEQQVVGGCQSGLSIGRWAALLCGDGRQDRPCQQPQRPDGPGDAPQADLGEAWGVLDDAMGQVCATYACGFDDLLSAHATKVAARSNASRREGGGGARGIHGDGSGGGRATTTSTPTGEHTLPPFISSSVQLVLCDPPYNIRADRSLEQSAHDVFTSDDMQRAARLFQTVVRPGGHVLIFCSAGQLGPWMDTLKALKDMDPVGRKSLSAFRVDGHPLVAIKDAHAVNSLRQSTTNLSNKVEFIVHATRAGVSREECYAMVNYRTWNAVPSRFLAHDNVIDNVRPPHFKEVVLRWRDGSRQWIRPEQKCLALILELLLRFSQPGDIVLDTFAGTCVTAAACIRAVLGQHRLVISCDSDAVVMDASRARLRREFVNQVLVGGYESSGVVTSDVIAAARTIEAASVAAATATTAAGAGGETGSEGRGDSGAAVGEEIELMINPPSSVMGDDAAVWEPPPGLPCHSALSLELVRYFAGRWAMQADAERVGRVAQTPGLPRPGADVGVEVARLEGVGVGSWPRLYQCALAVEDAEVALHVSAAHLGLYVAQSRLAGGTAGRGVFALRPFKRQDAIGPFWGAIVYADLTKQRVKTPRYAASVLGAHGPTAREFSERAMEVVFDELDVDGPNDAVEADVGGGGPGNQEHADVRRPRHHRRRRYDDGEEGGGGGRTMRKRHNQKGHNHGGGGPAADLGTGTLAGCRGVPTSLFIVPSPLCVTGYVNDGRATSPVDAEATLAQTGAGPADSDGRRGGAGGRRGDRGDVWLVRPNVVIVANVDDAQPVRLTPAHFVRPDMMVVIALRDIAVGEELVADYGPDYVFSSADWERRGRASGAGVLLSHSTPHTFAPMSG